MNIEDYKTACDVILEQRNEVQKTIENMLLLFKNGSLDTSGIQFQESLHFLQEKRNDNDFDFAYDQLAHVIQCEKAQNA